VSEEFGLPQPIGVENLELRALSEEHGKLDATVPRNVSLQPGEKVRLLPSHCCTTVNLHDRLHVIQNDALVDIWPISARGRAQ
jgi:D-serine deaminase-like pyridoxal phosphate-dependent protein